MPGILYVVATPIGNLEDVTLRALRVLREVTLVAAEDTRRTARLLQHYSIRTQTTSLHEHNERSRTPALIERLRRGESVALVSDAGTPLLSDPGAMLVAAAHDAGIRVEPVPGPSAALAALSASGVTSDGFIFAGFPPYRSVARKRWLTTFADEPRAVILFEAPHRIRALLADLSEIFPGRRVTLGRELTKMHEQLVVCQINPDLGEGIEAKGEFTLVIHPPTAPSTRGEGAAGVIAPDRLRDEFGDLTNISGLTRREALRVLATKYNLPAREVYRLVEEGKQLAD